MSRTNRQIEELKVMDQACSNWIKAAEWGSGETATPGIRAIAAMGFEAGWMGRDEEIAQLRSALESARHALVTLHGYWASDEPGAYGEAIRDGVAADDAWQIFAETCHTIDEIAEIAKIDAALAATEVSRDA